MAVKAKTGISGKVTVISKPKNTRQGASNHTKTSATSRNGRKKAYRGQGK